MTVDATRYNSIQEAIDASYPGGEVDFSDSQYEFPSNTPVVVPHSLIWKGGKFLRTEGQILVLVDTDGTVVFKNVKEVSPNPRNQSSFRQAPGSRQEKLVFENVRLDTVDIDMRGASDHVILDRCRVGSGVNGAHISFTGWTDNLNVSDCVVAGDGVTGNTAAFAFNGWASFATFERNEAWNHPEDGFEFDGAGGYELDFFNNRTLYCAKEGVEFKKGPGIARQIHCKGHYSINCQTHIQIALPGIVEECQLVGGTRAIRANQVGGQIIRNNYLSGWGAHGIWLDGESGEPAPHLAQVYGNNLNGLNVSERGIRCRNTIAFIHNNQIFNVTQAGIEFTAIDGQQYKGSEAYRNLIASSGEGIVISTPDYDSTYLTRLWDNRSANLVGNELRVRNGGSYEEPLGKSAFVVYPSTYFTF